jgi:hypothetical protein
MNEAIKPLNPKLVDKTIGDIQDGLISGLPWLNKAFGQAERLVKNIDGEKVFTPNVYLSGNDYFLILPDSKIGNHCFFYIDDPQELDSEALPETTGNITVDFSLIFWFDMRTIYNDPNVRNKEDVKSQILKILNGGFHLKSGRIRLYKIYEKAENIYDDFSLDEIDNQFLMHPFAGFKFTGEMIVFENC